MVMAGCSGAQDSSVGSSEEAVRTQGDKLGEICDEYSYSPELDHLVYRTCATDGVASKTGIIDLRTGEQRFIPEVAASSAGKVPRYMAFTEGFVLRNRDKFEFFDWKGVSKAVIAHPLLEDIFVDKHVRPIRGGTALLVWVADRQHPGQLYTLVSVDGESANVRSERLPTSNPILRGIEAPDGSHVLVYDETGLVFRVSTKNEPTRALPKLSYVPWPATYDGHTMLADGFDPYPGSSSAHSGRLLYVDLDNNRITPISTYKLQGFGTEPLSQTPEDGPRHRFLPVHRGDTYYFGEAGQGKYRVSSWNRANPDAALVMLASGDAAPPAGALGNPPLVFDMQLTEDKNHIVYYVSGTNPAPGSKTLRTVRADGSSPEKTLGKFDTFSSAGKGAKVVWALGENATWMDLEVGTSTTFVVGPGGAYEGWTLGGTQRELALSRDGNVLFNDRLFYREYGSYRGSTIQAGTAGHAAMSLVYQSEGPPISHGDANNQVNARSRVPVGDRGLLVIDLVTSSSRWAMIRVQP